MSIKQILEQIKENEAYLKTEIDPNDKTARFKYGMINQAKQQISVLKTSLRDEIFKNAVYVVVTGTKAKKMADYMRNDFSILDASPDLLGNEIVAQLSPTVYSDVPMHASVIEMITTVLDQITKEIGIIHYPAIIYSSEKHSVHLKNKQALVDLVNETLVRVIGSEIFAIYAAYRAMENMLADGEYDQPVVPFVVEVSESLVDQLSADLKNVNKNVFVVNAGGDAKADLKLNSKSKDISKETVAKLLTEIKNNLK